MSWTEEKVAVLQKHWGSGKSASEIAEIIGGMSRNAVIGKAHRLGLAGQPTPAKEKKAKAKQATVPAEPATAVDASAPADAPSRPQAATAKVIALQPGGGATILALTERMCRWPHGDPKKPGFRFCGKSATPGVPYCTEHLKMAYQAPAPKRRDAERRAVSA